MAKLRKMFGDINSDECISMMKLIETQSHVMLATWAINYAENNYLEIYMKEYPKDLRFENLISDCKKYLTGDIKLNEIKQRLKESRQIANEFENNPIAQAAARAISTACATIQTPTNSVGFIFYGAATVAYSEVGITEKVEIYENIALKEFKKAFDSLKEVSVPDEKNPVKIKWNC